MSDFISDGSGNEFSGDVRAFDHDWSTINFANNSFLLCSYANQTISGSTKCDFTQQSTCGLCSNAWNSCNVTVSDVSCTVPDGGGFFPATPAVPFPEIRVLALAHCWQNISGNIFAYFGYEAES